MTSRPSLVSHIPRRSSNINCPVSQTGRPSTTTGSQPPALNRESMCAILQNNMNMNNYNGTLQQQQQQAPSNTNRKSSLGRSSSFGSRASSIMGMCGGGIGGAKNDPKLNQIELAQTIIFVYIFSYINKLYNIRLIFFYCFVLSFIFLLNSKYLEHSKCRPRI